MRGRVRRGRRAPGIAGRDRRGGTSASVGTYLLNLVAESDACFGPSASSDARAAARVGGSSALRFVPASAGDGGGTATAGLGGASSVMPGDGPRAAECARSAARANSFNVIKNKKSSWESRT